MPPKADIEGLFWPTGSEEHVERHIAAWEIEELIEGGSFYVFRNIKGHPPNRRRVIGRTSDGVFVTAILEEPSDGDPTRWRPITGWRSTNVEREMYVKETKRLKKKQGRKHG